MVENATDQAAPTTQRPRPILRIGAVILGFVVIAVGLWALQGGMATLGQGPRDGTPRVGDRAPDFTAKALNGNTVQLSELRGRPVLINFWATWCPPCQAEMPAIDAVARSQPDLAILAINLMEGPVLVDRWQRDRQFSFVPLLDPDGEIGGKYRVNILPSSFFIGPDGTIRAISLGSLDQSTIEWNVEQARR